MSKLTRSPERLTRAHMLATFAFISTLLVSQQSQAHEQGRYTMMETKNGVIRLDKKTGTMSTCKSNNNQWSCTPIKDRSDADNNIDNQDTIAALKNENLKLKQQLQDLQLDETKESFKPGKNGEKKKLQLPSEEEVDEAITYMEKMIRKFGGAMKRLRDQEQTPHQEL